MSPPATKNSPAAAGRSVKGGERISRRIDRSAPPLPSNRPGDALLAKIERYCLATSTKETSIGRLLFRHDGFVALLRLRGSLSMGKRIAVEKLLEDYPGGLHGVELPPQRMCEPKPKASKASKSAGRSDHRIDTDQLEEMRQQADEVRAKRASGESVADRFRRLAREVEDEEAAATAELEARERRERDLERIPSPSALLRRAMRDWPSQCAAVQQLAAELGVSLAEAWRRTIAAGVQCLSESADEGVAA